jgi:hypothetical protein
MKKTAIYKPNYLVEVIQLEGNAEQQEAVAKWCKGQVKGTLLQPIDRVVEIKNTISDGEVVANVGDFIVKYYRGDSIIGWNVLEASHFNSLYVKQQE